MNVLTKKILKDFMTKKFVKYITHNSYAISVMLIF